MSAATAAQAVFAVSVAVVALSVIGLVALRPGSRLSRWLDRSVDQAVTLPRSRS